MRVYHGSYKEIPCPDIVYSRMNVDFGRGFYTTPFLEQAQTWCRKFKKERKAAVVSVYDLNEQMLDECSVLRFDSYSEEWLDFILKCRRGEDESDYEIVMGGIANDRVFNTVELFMNGLIDKKEALKRLRYEKPNYQIAFRTQSIISRCLRFERSEQV